MISEYLKNKQVMIENALHECLPEINTRPFVLHKAMHYCVLNGGKRIRPILCIAVAEVCGNSHALLPALSTELYHCSTLVHDDLPCMDDDDLRRGIPSCHIKFGSANAILTGDALLIHAFQILAETGEPRLTLELAQAAGSRGVVAGQVEDLAAAGQEPNADLLDFIHVHKTAILIRAAVRMGAILGNADEQDLKYFTLFGEKIGLAFQIEDDILDETSSEEVLGKPVGSDQEKNKLTYPAVHGMEAARSAAARLTHEALVALEAIDRDTSVLEGIATYLVNRQY